MPSRRIPQEIYDEIIATLRDDEATLRSCSVVCRAWLFRTRHHLFHTIALDPSSRSHRYKALVHSCPDAALLVRVLKLRGRASMRRGWWDPENGVPAILVWPTLPGSGTQTNPFHRESDVLETLSWLRDTLTSTSHGRPGAINLPNVRSLRLDEVTFNTGTASFLAASFPRVESSTLSGCRAMAFTSLQGMFQSVQQLRSLHLLSADCLPHQSGPPSLTTTLASPPLATLTHLEFTRPPGA